MTKRIFRSICFVALMVLLVALVFTMGILYDYFSKMQQTQLRMQTNLAAQGVMHEGMGYFSDLDPKDYRITWLDAKGNVLYDSQADSSAMENHADRKEFKEAMKTGYGQSTRYSKTLTERLLYSAQKLPDGSILRLSFAQNSILTLLLGMLQPMIILCVAVLIAALCLAARLSKKIVQPLNHLDLDHPLSNEGYDELSPLFRRIHSQQQQLKQQKQELQQRQNEFSAITESMNEGLILVGSTGNILSINPAAAQFFGTDASARGKDLLSINRALPLQKLLQEAQKGQHKEIILPLQKKFYQINASPILSGETVSGVVLLLFDATEKETAEQMRREFTANVSHELKTPLHAISGYAELLDHQMVKPEDQQPFAHQIYLEAQRLMHLIEDIINLSHLDEGARDMEWVQTDLYALAEKTIAQLSSEAKAAGVSLHLSGEHACLSGIPQLLGSILYNLCENAIKYNREGGSVSIEIAKETGGIRLSVEDTGIGIPPSQQNRIFERFYRARQSHPKEVNGTGLGLSIVKHGASIHHASIQLQSTPGKGTKITLHFPV